MKPKSTASEVDDEVKHIFVLFLTLTLQEKKLQIATVKTKPKILHPRAPQQKHLQLDFEDYVEDTPAELSFCIGGLRHRAAVAILAGGTYPTAAAAARPCKKGRVFPN